MNADTLPSVRMLAGATLSTEDAGQGTAAQRNPGPVLAIRQQRESKKRFHHDCRGLGSR